MLDELWENVWGNGWTYRKIELAADIPLVLLYYFADSVNLHQYFLCLTDDLHTGKGRGDRLICTLEDAEIQFFFELNNHSTQSWLSDITRVSRFRKTTKAVDSCDISELLKSHS